MYSLQNKQSGVALITAMIITSIAISLAGTVMYRQQIHIRLSSNISHLEQSYLYAKGMEDWAGTILERTYKDHKDYDSLEDDWAVLLPPIPIPGGVMNGQLYDLQARINLNSLARPKPRAPQGGAGGGTPQGGAGGGAPQRGAGSGAPPTPTKPYVAEITKKQLKNLMIQLDPDQDMGPPENFVDILSDWIDKDQDTSDFGAESDYYQSLEPAYFSADSVLVSPTELRLLKDMKKKIYDKLLKHLTTLPIKTETPINVNTASLEILKAVGFDPASAEAIRKEVEKRPFRNHNEFKEYLDNNADVTKPENFDEKLEIKNLSVNSNFFLLQGNVKINNARLFINSILERKNGKVSVIMRDFRNP
ncbi:MAG TPA: general secretion pathway protein GspK [Leucothrix sp.]|nr:general secretion pathway protein GspK [Leucothrix sp.]